MRDPAALALDNPEDGIETGAVLRGGDPRENGKIGQIGRIYRKPADEDRL